jgi:hypothetical protein
MSREYYENFKINKKTPFYLNNPGLYSELKKIHSQPILKNGNSEGK